MKILSYIVFFIFKMYYLLLASSILLVTLPFMLFFQGKSQASLKRLQFIKYLQSSLFVILGGIKIEVQGKEYIDSDKCYIITPNHTTYIDIIILVYVLRKLSPAFLGKEELRKLPIIGQLYFNGLNITVDRKNPLASKNFLAQIIQKIKTRKSIIIFPEGGINKNNLDGLDRFKDGPFRIAVNHNLPVLPVYIKESYKIVTASNFLVSPSKPGKVVVKIANPINPSNFNKKTAAIEIKNLTFDTINTMMLNE